MSPLQAKKRDFRRSSDFSLDDILTVFDIARQLKAELREPGQPHHPLRGKALVMIFEKPSLRTRCTFELAMVQLGGHAIYLSPSEIGLGERESVPDVAHNLERWFDIAMARTFLQSTIDGLAENCTIPVINALSDDEHPCQALADFLTLVEKFDMVKGRHLTYIGDGNNICHSLMVTGARLGVRMTVCTPRGFEPAKHYVDLTLTESKRHGGSFRLTYDPVEAVKDAEAIYTDVWASMGQENEAESRRAIFKPYQVNEKLLTRAPKDALIMHDLPAHRGEEITSEVLDGPNSIVFDQAENRLHAQKGVIVFLHKHSAPLRD